MGRGPRTWACTPSDSGHLFHHLRDLRGEGAHTTCDVGPRSNMHPEKPLTLETRFPSPPLCRRNPSLSPQPCFFPGLSASFPPASCPLHPASLRKSGCASQPLLAWTELNPLREKLHSLLGHLGTLPNQGHTLLTSPVEVSGRPGSGCKSAGVPTHGSDSLVRLFSLCLTQCQGRDTCLLPFVLAGSCLACS